MTTGSPPPTSFTAQSVIALLPIAIKRKTPLRTGDRKNNGVLRSISLMTKMINKGEYALRNNNNDTSGRSLRDGSLIAALVSGWTTFFSKSADHTEPQTVRAVNDAIRQSRPAP